MRTPRTKKSPAPSTAKKTGAEPRAAHPGGRPSRVYAPSKAAKTANTAGKSALGKLAAFGGEARLEERVAALERAVMTLAVHLPAALFDVQGHADAKTKRILADLEDLFNVAGTLTRLRLPEEAYDVAFEEWESLPHAPKDRWNEANRRLGDRLVALGLVGEEERIPVPVVTIDADAGAPPEVREAGSALVWLCQNDRDEEVTELAMDSRNALAERVYEALGRPDGEAASVLTDVAVRHVVSGLTAEAVLVLVRTRPELVLEARRNVETLRAERAGR